MGIYGFVDTMEVDDPIAKLSKLKQLPDVVILHRAINVEQSSDSQSSDAAQKARWAAIPKIKEIYKDTKLASGRDRVLVAVAGGIDPATAKYALAQEADILLVGRFITSAKDVENAPFISPSTLNLLPTYLSKPLNPNPEPENTFRNSPNITTKIN